MTPVRLGARLIGPGHPCYIVAEAGVNHNGDLETALKLIDTASRCGADAVKFQKREPTAGLTRHALDAPYDGPHSYGRTYGEHRRALELSDEDWRVMREHALTVGIDFFASPWDRPSLRFLEALGVGCYKVASADLTNLPLLREIAALRRPVFLSTGMSEWDEVLDAVQTIRQVHDQLVVLHCTSSYPAEYGDLNLRAMLRMGQELGVPYGWSGHERGLATTCAAVALGASVVERHVTLDRTAKGPDHAASLEPEGLRRLVRDIRHIETAMGSDVKRLLDCERRVRERLGKSLVTTCPVPEGHVFVAGDIAVKGPGTGLTGRWADALIGRIAMRTLPADSVIPPEALDWPRAA